MTPEQLYKDALKAKEQGSHLGMSLFLSKGNKRPPGFPRGKLLCETERGRVYSFSPDKVIEWLKKNGLTPGGNMGTDVECPYCGAGVMLNHDDGYGLEEDLIHLEKCAYCEKTFAYRTYVTNFYEAEKADCWNGGEHQYRTGAVYDPDRREITACRICEHVKEPATP